MNIIIRENERGLLFQNGVYQRMLEPGLRRYSRLRRQEVFLVRAQGEIALPGREAGGVTAKLLMRDEAFAACVAAVSVPDEKLAMHFVDGRLAGALPAGEYFFWNLHKVNTFRLLDMAQPETDGVPAEYFRHIPLKLYTRVEVMEGECALLYYDGAFQRRLGGGTHYFWNGGVKVTAQKLDLRAQQMDVPGQEILTADKVGLRINFVCTFRITDPVSLAGRLKDFADQVYSLVQLSLRQLIGGYRLDELLENKNGIAAFVLDRLRAGQERLYIEFLDAGIKDIILPGEIRAIMNTVLVAEKTAQANVISRREEVASTRSLLNTARLMEENDTLRRLKELEYLERICDRVGSISVGGGNLLAQLQELVTSPR